MKNIKDIEKIAKAYKSIQKHHDDIVKLEKIVELIVNDENGVSLSIKKKLQKDDNVKFDEDGSIVNENQQFSYIGFITNAWRYSSEQDSEDDSLSFNTELNDILSLELIGMIIREKRSIIEKTLKKLGV